MRKIFDKKSRLVLLIVCAALIIASVICFVFAGSLPKKLVSQYTAEQWKGENELDFSQLGIYLPAGSGVTRSEVYSFRMVLMDKLVEAAVEADDPSRMILDAWSTSGTVNVSSDRAKMSVKATVVGGDYFSFHPLMLDDGGYICENDFMEDRVVIDRELAWFLFGGYELAGMELNINGIPFYIAGVVERESDFATKEAYSDGMGLYMSYDAYCTLTESEPEIESYELVFAEPVEGFTKKAAEEKFPVGSGEIVQITGRFGYWSMMRAFLHAGERSMRGSAAVYPYWENAARYMENLVMWLFAVGTVLLLFPAVLLAIIVIKLLIRLKDKLVEVVFPKLKDKISEAIRVRQRKHWEKVNAKSDK